MKKTGFISKVILFLNSLAVLGLLAGYLAPYVSPNSFWPLAFVGLAVPYLFIINFLFLLFWLLKGRMLWLLSFVILGLGYKTFPAYVQIPLKQTEEIESEGFKILSFNVRIFDLYMWTEDKSTRNKIFDFLKKEEPDILCLQEFYQRDIQHPDYEFKTLDTLIQFLKAKNYHTYYTTNLREVDHWGIITFSKYPILNRQTVPFAHRDDNVCIFTDIQHPQGVFRLFNMHLASIKLEKHDYKAMREVNDNAYSKNFEKERMVLGKLKAGFINRAAQADSIRKAIAASPYPVVLCGDFNDTPSSYAYQKIKGKLNDAFMESGTGLGRTYIGEFPSYRIDYILYDDHFQSRDYTTHSEKLSDHHPVSTTLYFN